MRLFLGVWLSSAQRSELERLLVNLRNRYPGWKWTSPGNLHITLKFLGEVSPDRVAILKDSFTACAKSMSCYQIRLGSMGTFPEQGAPKVLWVSITIGKTQLMQQAALIENIGEEMGFSRESRPFRPHLTIARAGSGVVAARPQQEYSLRSCTEVASFALIESKLTTSGSIYRTVAEFPLGQMK